MYHMIPQSYTKITNVFFAKNQIKNYVLNLEAYNN